MKNDPYFKLIAFSIFLGALLAIAAPHIHAAVPLPAIHVTAQAPEWQRLLTHPARPAPGANLAVPAARPNVAPPAMPEPQPVDLPLRT